MKSQMQIVQEAIARLEEMSRGEFVESLVSSGLVEKELAHHEVFSHVVTVTDLVEVVAPSQSSDITALHVVAGKELSFAF